MPTFKQKNVIKSYKLRLQEKLKTITEETDNATHFLNNRLLEFKNRVQHILEIKDEKCLSLYRKLITDLESYSEKLFILQASFEEATEEESESSQDEDEDREISKPPSKTLPDFPPVDGASSTVSSAVLSSATLPDFPPVDGASSTVSSMVLSSAKEEENFVFNYQDEDGGSITEDDFCSLHSDNNLQNTNSTLLNHQTEEYHSEFISGDKSESSINASQNSCYRSISSNISEPFSIHVGNNSLQCVETYSLESKNKGSLESAKATFVIQSTNLEIPSHFSATLSYIIDPGNFWIQMENSHGSNISFPKSQCISMKKLLSIKKGSFCLAPFKSSSFYYRAKSLSNAKSEKELVKVLFIDHGSTQDISLCDLRPLPAAAYAISAQAIHCHLYGILPKNGSWSNEAIEYFKDFQNCCIETFVKSKEKSYGVELATKLSAELNEDYSIDVGEALCVNGLAVSLNECHVQSMSSNQLSTPQCNKAESSLEVSGSYDINAISSDSGVSVTSAYKSSQVSTQKNAIINKDSKDCSSVAVNNKFFSPCNTKLIGFNHDTQIKDLISFDSYDALEFQNSIENLKLSDRCFTSSCLVCRRKDFCLHLKIPSPSLFFVEKDMMIVMLSHIVNPHEFYVNMAMENSMSLDDLREQMTNVYESQQNQQQINVEDLSENMFCASRFVQDNYWYRFKILRISSDDLQRHQVFGQYIDYGNVATVKLCDLQPLTPQFSQHPLFAIKCSLAGVMPIGNESALWKDDAINVFKKLTSFDRCLTAQICDELASDKNDNYPVLLWDNKDSLDLLINSSLADENVAVFDYTLLNSSLSTQTAVKTLKDIDSWDPMLEEYYHPENSYAVNDEDLEVATTGYHAQDEKYTCKYFSLHNHCSRGENCPYEHYPLLESGVTRDREEVYCLDSFPIISEDISNILVQVSAIVNPGHFYAILPFGCKTVQEIDELVYNGSSYKEIVNSEAKALFYALDKHYSKTPFQENTKIALSCGTIVAAKRKWDDKWHRGRIVDVVGTDKPAKVFFVDSGDQEWVSRRFIRTISPRFLHTPFQAIQCSLYEIEPIGFEKGQSWSSAAMNCFKDIVAGEILLADVVLRFGHIFHVSLRKTSQQDRHNIAQLLVSAGYAQYNKVIPSSDKKKILYVPG